MLGENTISSGSNGGGGGGGGSGGGPCGACKFLRRKCIKGCIFAPYFDSEQGATHFAAVHKIFGASNVSKLLLKIPVHKRLDAVVTICYEALARLRDPVYGCVGHIFALQQQVVNLQAELAFVQAHLSTMELTSQSMLVPTTDQSTSSMADMYPSSNFGCEAPEQMQQPQFTSETASYCCGLVEQPVDDDGDLHALAREFVSRYLPGVKVRPSSSC